MCKQSSNPNFSVLVISPLKSIIEEQIRELNELALPSVHLKENEPQRMANTSQRKFRFIFCSAERCLSKEFQDLLKSEHEGPEIDIILARKTKFSDQIGQTTFSHSHPLGDLK